MINTLFKQFLLSGILISIVYFCTILFSSVLDRYYRRCWRLNVWKVSVFILIMPIYKILCAAFSYLKMQYSIEPETVICLSPKIDAALQSVNSLSAAIDMDTSPVTGFSPLTFISILWLVGMFLFFLYYISLYFHLIFKIKKNSFLISDIRFEKLQQSHLHQRTLPIFLCQGAISPMILGFFKPVIIIPKRIYTSDQLDLILLHEITHYKRKDLLFKGFSLIALFINWYNPLIHKMMEKINEDIEICCDYDVLCDLGKHKKSEYCDTIINEALSRHQRKKVPLSCMASEKQCLEQRIKKIFDKNKKKNFICAISVLLVSVSVLTGSAFLNIFASNPENSNTSLNENPTALRLFQTVAVPSQKSHGQNIPVSETFTTETPYDTTIADYISGIEDTEKRNLITEYWTTPIEGDSGIYIGAEEIEKHHQKQEEQISPEAVKKHLHKLKQMEQMSVSELSEIVREAKDSSIH